jgi:hypothetical protein
MPRKKTDFNTVRRLGLALPGVTEGTAYGSPALKVHGKMFTCVPTHRSAEAGSLAVRLDFAQRDELIAAEPDTYYLKEHYVDYPIVLVRLARVDEETLRDLLGMACRYMSANARAGRPRRRGRPPGRSRKGASGSPG